jgi:hypothetical protein
MHFRMRLLQPRAEVQCFARKALAHIHQNPGICSRVTEAERLGEIMCHINRERMGTEDRRSHVLLWLSAADKENSPAPNWIRRRHRFPPPPITHSSLALLHVSRRVSPGEVAYRRSIPGGACRRGHAWLFLRGCSRGYRRREEDVLGCLTAALTVSPVPRIGCAPNRLHATSIRRLTRRVQVHGYAPQKGRAVRH